MIHNKRRTIAVLIAALASAPVFADQNVTVSVSKIKDLNIRMYGFVESDVIADTTQGFTEEMDSNLVAKPNTYAGQNHRTQMSIRNSRLGFDLTVPKMDNGLQTEAVLEMDMMGNNAPNTNPGSAAGTQSQRDFFNNPAVRIRHAFVNLTYNDWNAKIGQYWSLLGWQPYYFPGETVVQPGPGQLYRRFAQMRATYTNTHTLPDWSLEAAADIAKPADINSGAPEAHAGLRIASTKWKSPSVSGAGTSMVGLSAAVSDAVIQTKTNGFGNPTGNVMAVDFSVPLIPSPDGVEKGNTLTWMGEGVAGQGFGGLEMAGLTFGVGGWNNGTTNIDSGIGGLNPATGTFELIQARAFRTHLQYVLPGGKWALSSGYAQAEARNLDRFGTSTALAPKIQYGYVSAFYDATAWLRFAAEVNQQKDTYNDAANRHAANNRYQFTTFFVF